MQTLQQELEPTQHGLNTTGHPVFREMMADPVVAYAEEVRSLRQRVALLESELAATKATATPVRPTPPLTSIDFAPAHAPERRVSEFTQPVTPAVMAVQPVNRPAPAAEPAAVAAEPLHGDTETVEQPGFAQAWTAESATASFEERVAEKAFFQASTVDEESRSWLLEQ